MSRRRSFAITAAPPFILIVRVLHYYNYWLREVFMNISISNTKEIAGDTAADRGASLIIEPPLKRKAGLLLLLLREQVSLKCSTVLSHSRDIDWSQSRRFSP